MALVQSASYNTSTKKWVITVTHSNWGGCGIRTTTFTGVLASSSLCPSGANWGDLYGVNFYVRR